MSERLKPLFIWYGAVGLLFIAVFAASVMCAKKEKFLGERVTALEKTKRNSVQIHEALVNIEGTVADLDTILPAPARSRTPESAILSGVDTVRSRMKDAEIIVANFDTRPEEVSLPITIKQPVADYTAFVNRVGFLQSLQFPFFSIKSITLGQPKEDKPVTATTEGVMKMPLIKGKGEQKRI